MSVLLATDRLELYPPAGADDHGWALGGSEPVWSGRGALQLGAGSTAVGANLAGGHGPHDPLSSPVGAVYLPADAPAADGMVLSARGARYTLGSTRLVTDPAGAGAECITAALVGYDPAEAEP